MNKRNKEKKTIKKKRENENKREMEIMIRVMEENRMYEEGEEEKEDKKLVEEGDVEEEVEEEEDYDARQTFTEAALEKILRISNILPDDSESLRVALSTETEDAANYLRDRVVGNPFLVSDSKDTQFRQMSGMEKLSASALCCAVCARVTWPDDSRLVNTKRLPKNFFSRLRCPVVGLPRAILDTYNIFPLLHKRNQNELFKTTLLCQDGVEDFKNGRGQQGLRICHSCTHSLRAVQSSSRTNPPKFAIANHLWMGQLPEELFQKANEMELRLMSPYQRTGRVHFQRGRMNGILTGHRHSFFLDNQVVFDSLPLKPSEVVDSVVLAGPFTKDERIAALRPVEVRADILRAILAAYHEHENPLFEDIHINQENLNLYEEKENSEGTAFLIVEAEDYVVVDEKAKTASLTGGLNLLLDAVR